MKKIIIAFVLFSFFSCKKCIKCTITSVYENGTEVKTEEQFCEKKKKREEFKENLTKNSESIGSQNSVACE